MFIVFCKTKPGANVEDNSIPYNITPNQESNRRGKLVRQLVHSLSFRCFITVCPIKQKLLTLWNGGLAY